MTQGISSSLNLALARIYGIENNFKALQNLSNAQNARALGCVEGKNQDFQTVLDNKINENSQIEDIIYPDEEISNDKISDKIEDEAQNKALELKDKIKNTIDKIETAPIFDTEEDTQPLLKDPILEITNPVNLKSKINLNLSKNENIEDIIETFANKYDVDANFIKAIIKQESGFKPNATSKKGAMGLMQLMPQTAKSLGVIDAYNPRDNIEGGVKYLKNLLNNYNGDKELALAAYNAGAGAVKKYGGIPPYKETQNYIKNIMASYDRLNEVNL